MFEPRRELDWQLEAKCYGSEYPEFWDADNIGSRAQAERLCSGCPVRKQCRKLAEETFSVSEYIGLPNEVGARLKTTGVVMDGRVW